TATMPAAPTATVDATARPTLTCAPSAAIPPTEETEAPLAEDTEDTEDTDETEDADDADAATAPPVAPPDVATRPAAGTSRTRMPACDRRVEQTSISSSWVARHDAHEDRWARTLRASAPVTLPAVYPPSFSTIVRQPFALRPVDRCACRYAARRPMRARRASAAVALGLR